MKPPEPSAQPKPDRKGLRLCVACRRYFPPETMLAVIHNRQHQAWTVRWPAGLAQTAETASVRLFGRSAYACYNTVCLTEALRARKFPRALKQTCPGDILKSLADCSPPEGQTTH
ncbi:MAG: YlxR family protein [Candidatus Melainabacteria bacterium]